MNHAEVQAWLDEAFFTPGVLERDDPAAHAVRDHLAACAECSTHDAALRRTGLMLALARGPSPQVRDRVLETVRRLGRPVPVQAGRGSETGARTPSEAAGLARLWRWAAGWRLAAAVLAVGVVAAAVGAMLGQSMDSGSVQAQRLARAVTKMSELSADPSTHAMVLRDSAGNAGGVALMSPATNEIALFSPALAQPAQGGEYHCYLEHDGQREWIGLMQFADGLTFWAGPMDESMEAGPDHWVVVAADEGAPAMLSAQF
jgi:hypothetical protein